VDLEKEKGEEVHDGCSDLTLVVRPIITAWPTERSNERSDAGLCYTSASGHFLNGSGFVRSDAQGVRQVRGDVR
jgi:hypothetical protein